MALRRGELRQTFLLALSDALRRSDPGEVLATACRVLGEHLGANRVGYAEDRGDGVTIEVTCNEQRVEERTADNQGALPAARLGAGGRAAAHGARHPRSARPADDRAAAEHRGAEFGVNAVVDVPGGDQTRLPADIEANLYRIAQESLHNVVKHAAATHVLVRLERTAGGTVLTIADDGRGFDPSAATEPGEARGLGLVGMRERARLAGGRLEIASTPGKGASIVVRVPADRVAD